MKTKSFIVRDVTMVEEMLKENIGGKMENEIRYFSMFSGVGGFELGLEASNSKSLPKVEQDWEGWNRHINEWGELLRTRSIPTLSSLRSNESSVSCRSGEHNNTKNECVKWKCVGMSEWDKYSSQVLAERFPTIKNWGDCTKINPAELPDFDMLCGGFPCQAFSIAGKRRGFEDTRGTMFFEVARILKVKRPKTVLLENVKGLLNHNKGETFRVILQTLDELGYEVQWMVLNSKFFGVPQNRERVFIIGNLRGTSKSEILPFGEDDGEINQVHPAIDANYYKGYSNQRKLLQLNNPTHSNNRIYGEEGISPSLNTAQEGNRQPKIQAVLTPDKPNKRQNGRRFKEEGEPSFTITGQDIHGVTDGIKIRRLTPVECCRLQGFPDDWNEYGIDTNGNKVKMSDTQRYKQMGNAVTTNVITAIGSQILNKTNGGEIDGKKTN